MVDIDIIRAQSLRLLREEARRREEEELLENFHPDVQLCVIEEKGARKPISETLDDLKRCVEARETLHNLERGMDKDYFVKLVSSGFMLRSGIDRETGSVATWVRVGDFFKSCSHIPAGSPKAKAQTRAYIWFLETMVVQNTMRPDGRSALYTNCDMGPLDFNATTMKVTMTLMAHTFLAPSRTISSSFGLIRAVPLLWNMFCRLSSDTAASTRFLESYSDVLDMMTNPSDVPECWFSEEDLPNQRKLKRTNTWCFERCLSDDNKVSTKDLYNPDPWTYAPGEEVHSSIMLNFDERGARRAEAMYEFPGHSEESGTKRGTKLEKMSSPLTSIEEDEDEP